MELFKKTALAIMLLAASFTAFAKEQIPCPPLDAITSSADILETVSLQESQLGNYPRAYMVLSLNYLVYEHRYWHLATVAFAHDMDTALTYGRERVRAAVKQINEQADGMDPVYICWYKGLQDGPQDSSILALSLIFETNSHPLNVQDLKSILKNHKYSPEIK